MTALELLQQLGLGVVALVANTLSAFAGGGAGLVQLPALILLGLPFPMALATHKVASVALGIGAAGRHIHEGSLDRSLASLVLMAGLPGVWLGAHAVLTLPERFAATALGMMTIALGLYSINRPNLGTSTRQRPDTPRERLIGALVLFGIGVLNGSLTSGTGLFVTLWLVRWFGLSYTRAVAHTLILVGLCWNGAGALTLGIRGEIRWDWLPMLIAGSLLGGFVGAHLSLVSGSRWVKRVFELLALLMGSSLILRSI